MRMDPATGEVMSEEQASLNAMQESVFESTDLEAVYKRMIVKMLEAFAKYLRNGSGWTSPLAGCDHYEDPPTSSYPRSSQKGRPSST